MSSQQTAGDNASGSTKIGPTARIAIFCGFVVSAAAFIDAVYSIATKTQSATCWLGIALPWCSVPIGPPAGPATPATQVNGFEIKAFNSSGLPAGGQQSAVRDWKLVAPDRWEEIYPGGMPSYFDVIGRIMVNGCSGTVVQNEAAKSHRVFIPDKGCPGMFFYISDNNSDWGIASSMTNIQ